LAGSAEVPFIPLALLLSFSRSLSSSAIPSVSFSLSRAAHRIQSRARRRNGETKKQRKRDRQTEREREREREGEGERERREEREGEGREEEIEERRGRSREESRRRRSRRSGEDKVSFYSPPGLGRYHSMARRVRFASSRVLSLSRFHPGATQAHKRIYAYVRTSTYARVRLYGIHVRGIRGRTRSAFLARWKRNGETEGEREKLCTIRHTTSCKPHGPVEPHSKAAPWMRPAMALESIGEEEGRSGEDTERKEKKAEESARSSGRKREGERERERERERESARE
jgi:hypothetical protein